MNCKCPLNVYRNQKYATKPKRFNLKYTAYTRSSHFVPMQGTVVNCTAHCPPWLEYNLQFFTVSCFLLYVPYVPPSSCCFQIGIWSPKQHHFDRKFCVGLPQTLCKQWTKGFCKILKFWPLHSVRQNVAGFRRGLFTCFLGHTSLLPAFWATTVIMGCGPKSR